jgi:hypothetical protein
MTAQDDPIDFGEEPVGATTTALEQKYSKQMRQIVSQKIDLPISTLPNMIKDQINLNGIDCYVHASRYTDAIAEARKLSEVPGDPRTRVLLSYSYAAAGKKGEARRALASFGALTEGHFVQPLSVAATYALHNGTDFGCTQLVRVLMIQPRIGKASSRPSRSANLTMYKTDLGNRTTSNNTGDHNPAND